MGHGYEIIPVTRWGWGCDKSLIRVEFGYEDEDVCFNYDYWLNMTLQGILTQYYYDYYVISVSHYFTLPILLHRPLSLKILLIPSIFLGKIHTFHKFTNMS